MDGVARSLQPGRPVTATALDDALLGAVIGKLPMPGGAWTKADRIAWLRMFVMAADVAYGVAPGVSIADVEERAPLRFVPETGPINPHMPADYAAKLEALPVAQPTAEPQTRDQLEAAAAAEAAAAGPLIFIDHDGFAMRGALAIDPGDIPNGSVVPDQRQGLERCDMETIYWKTGGIKKIPPNHFKLEAAR